MSPLELEDAGRMLEERSAFLRHFCGDVLEADGYTWAGNVCCNEPSVC